MTARREPLAAGSFVAEQAQMQQKRLEQASAQASTIQRMTTKAELPSGGAEGPAAACAFGEVRDAVWAALIALGCCGVCNAGAMGAAKDVDSGMGTGSVVESGTCRSQLVTQGSSAVFARHSVGATQAQ